MAKLTGGQRKKLPGKEFAVPSKRPGPGSYPIPDASHGRNALARVSQFGAPSEKAEVRAKVAQKFPGIKSEKLGRHKEFEAWEKKVAKAMCGTGDARPKDGTY